MKASEKHERYRVTACGEVYPFFNDFTGIYMFRRK